MRNALHPTELLAVLADGFDDTALNDREEFPAVIIDLSGPFPREDLQRVVRLLSTMPVVAVGVSAEGPAGGHSAHGLDLLLCGGSGVAAPWVACGDALEETVHSLCGSICDAPAAAVALAQLLRVGESATVTDAIVAESWVYSLLQSGTRYSHWLQSRSTRIPRPRPESSVVAVDRDDDRLVIELCRPEVHNAYGTRMRDELVEAFRLVDVDSSVRSVILRGKGPSFCSGGDLDEFGTAPAPVEAHSIRTNRNAGVALATIADRVEVHVHGTCVGAGVELPAFAARVIAHSATTFLLPEVAMGLVPGAGGTASIPRRIGRHRTAFFGLCRTPIDTKTALDWGLIDAVNDSVINESWDADD